jgi:hypothetical protein
MRRTAMRDESMDIFLERSLFYLLQSAFWKANLTGVSSAFLKLDRWIIIINAVPHKVRQVNKFWHATGHTARYLG